MTAGKKNRTVAGRRREIGAALRSFRRRAGYERIEDVSDFLDVSDVTMGRIEKGEAPINRAYLGVLAEKYALTDTERDALMELARETRARKGVFPAYTSLKTRALLELEVEASEILAVAIDVIPVYFQTERYIEGLFDGSSEGQSREQIDDVIRVRRGRQVILTQPQPPVVRTIIHEMALRLPVGGAEVMHEQLMHLARLCDLPNVEIQVQPIEAGSYPYMSTSFLLVRLDNDPATDRVMVEGPGDNTHRDRPGTVEPYRLAWGRKQVSALSLPASKKLIRASARRFAPGTGQ